MGHYSDYYAYEKEKENERKLKQFKLALDLLEKSESAANLPIGRDIDVSDTALLTQYEILRGLLELAIARTK